MTEEDPAAGSRDYDRIAQAMAFLVEHRQDQPSLEALASHLAMSPHHLHRLFHRWAGVTPKRFLGCLTLNHAREVLAQNGSVLDAAYEAGLSGPSRLHDLCISHEALSPGELKAEGEGLTVRWGRHRTPLGLVQIEETERGICGLGFVDQSLDDGETPEPLCGLAKARFVQDQLSTGQSVAKLFPESHQLASAQTGQDRDVKVLLAGTNFQIKVWEALLRIPNGALVSYESVARAIGKPTAQRAVGRAVGANRIAFLIPCHRVVRAAGLPSGYRWGTARKLAILGRELSGPPSQSTA
ncbi:MAG: methylated-DNA--[protein]-cysteine S-methyltransferase [Rhodospirillaceae bacterium]